MKIFLLLLLIIIYSCHSSVRYKDDAVFQKALENGTQANEGYQRCLNFVNDWLGFADPITGLIPRNLGNSADIWDPKDSAADNYPFMVLTSAIVDHDLFHGQMSDILEAEKKYTSRIDRLPDVYSFSKRDFVSGKPDTSRIIFGAAEYVKDGLLALTEYLGQSPWSDRMVEILDDIWKHADYETPNGNIPSLNVEVNGELLQTLSRVYWMTGDKKYLEWAVRLGDYYLLGNNHPALDLEVLKLRDHGCEIVSGLCELYVTLAFASPPKRDQYRKPVYGMLDRILESGVNEHGMFYNQINPVTGEILNDGIADTWGYTYNAFYSVYMLDNHSPYRDAVLKVLGNLDNYRNFNWERFGADGYADAIESALNLYNREPVINVDEWIESQIGIMWSIQDSAQREGLEQWRNRGVIEGWHGDGNFARTTIMFCLWKTQGIIMVPWQKSLVYGAENDNGIIKLTISAEEDWSGELRFDTPRHRDIFNLPMDYPRINQFPEWFTVERDRKYSIRKLNKKSSRKYTGLQLVEGVPLDIKQGEKLYIEINPL